jgi:deazaflavin-dependent oxidoreductase (nitroreductase family)
LMNEETAKALETDRVIDITTTGRKSGKPRRTEIWFCNIDGSVYISGWPGTRGWYPNMVANPAFTFHLKESVKADLAATAIVIDDLDERRRVITQIAERYGATASVEEWVADSPLVRVELE